MDIFYGSGWEWVEIYFGWVGVGGHFYGWVGIGRGIFWVSKGGWTFFMGEWEWVRVGGGMFWVGRDA